MIGYDVVGRGPINVLVFSGWMSDHTVFDTLVVSLNKDKCTYYFIDYRGYGLSKDLKGEYSIQEIAADAIALADELKINKFNLIGHSMGGLVVQKIMSLAKDRVKKVIALNPVPASGYPMDEQSQGLFDGAIENNDNRKMIFDFTTGNRLSVDWLEAMTKSSVETTTKESYKAYLEAWTKTNIQSEIEGNDIPILVCYGEYDPAITKEMLEQTYFKWLPNASLKELKNAGHYPMQEIPIELANLIESFF